MLGRRIDIALRHESDDGGDQSVAELARNRFAGGAQNVVVFPRGEVRTVLLNAAGGNDHRVLAGTQGIAHFHPGQLFDEHRIDGRDRPRRIRIGPDWIGQRGQPAG